MVATCSILDNNDHHTLLGNPSSIKVALDRIQAAIDLINQNNNELLLFQQFATPIVTRLSNGKGTSQRGGQSAYGRLTKLEFPKFNGEDVQGWLYRVHQFILIDEVQYDSQRLILVSMHLFDKALNCHKQFLRRNVGSTRGICHKHVHWGLKEEIRIAVRMFKPTKLVDVYCLAKMQEASLVVAKSTYTPILSTPKNVVITYVPKSGEYNAKGNTLVLPATPQTVGPIRPRNQLTQQDMVEKRGKHLCFYCDQRYSHGYKCSGQMYCLEVMGYDKIIEDEDFVFSEQEPVPVNEVVKDPMPQVSLNAMNRVNNY
ncbi:hypothetical protein Tco_0801214 [Tanacetum coccineum]|uniref:Uncharacterized protein n=1 Tax=Tanacetum coccineum TaxID=301880 RepID=A0ABQ4ZY33_9ASTR